MARTFAQLVLAWAGVFGRKNLPWQREPNAYKIWLSEIMLQQTQVATVIGYFERFIAEFPDIEALARAEEDEVFRLWAGLGYYARARNLHKSAQIIMRQYQGVLPANFELLLSLPGIGRSTAGAIAAMAFNLNYPILDGNVKRVLTRVFGIRGWPGERLIEAQLWALSTKLTPATNSGAYTQAMMDLGATLCTRSQPSCDRCPLQAHCFAFQNQRIAQLPQPRPRNNKPTRETQVLILRAIDKVLLKKRPESGIWNGLWSVPELALTMSADSWLQDHGLIGLALHALPAFRHSFTHYHLIIHPLVIDVPSAATPPGDHIWYDISRLDQIGLPAPIKALLREIIIEEPV